MKLESDRIAFIENRDGKPAAVEFAKRTMGLYRRHVLKYRGLIARKSFILSYLDFKEYYLRSTQRTDKPYPGPGPATAETTEKAARGIVKAAKATYHAIKKFLKKRLSL